MELINAMNVSVSGLKAQGTRIRVISENIANANTEPNAPGEEPYARKTVSFKNVLDRETGVDKVQVSEINRQRGNFGTRFDPSHPGADANGYVLTTNVKPLLELNDVREAQRSYEANINMIEISRGMLSRTVELLR